MGLSQIKSHLTSRILLLGLSVISLVICAWAAAAHYRNLAWGDPWQPIGWLLSMFFLLVAAPWNGDALFDESANDLGYLKSHVIGHPYQAAWFHGIISRETLFHYYVWGFLKLFGFNILSYEAALFVIWLTAFVFTLLLVDLFFGSYIVTSVTALIFNFLPFAFIYTFVGYRYPLTVALAVVSLYFLHLGFRTTSRSYLSLGGIAAGLCLASSIPGKQYLLALVIAAPLYAVFYWRSLKRSVTLTSLAIVMYGFLAAAMPILCYIIFRHGDYTYYEGTYIRDFWHALRRTPAPHDVRYYVTGLWNCFFAAHFWPRLLFPDFLPIPLPYYWLLLPGFVLALWQKRFEVVLLATLPVVGVFVTGGPAVEQRLLLAIPFWIMLMSFTFAALLQLRPWPGMQIVLCVVSALVLLDGLGPSIRYIYTKTKSPFAIHHFAQGQVAVSRFLKHVVAGQQHPEPPRLERDEFNRIKGIPDPPYDTLICQNDAYSIIHLFLHDYDDGKILSFCSGFPFFWVMTEQEVWNANKRAILGYVPNNKDLKLIWERDPKTERIIRMFQSLHDLGTEDSMSFSFGGRLRTFYVLNIPNKNIRQFQRRVRALPATPGTPPPQLSSLPEGVTIMFEGGKGTDEGQFDSPTGIAVDANGNILVADTNNGRIQKFSPTGTFLSIIGSKGSGHGQLGEPNGIAIDRAGNIYVAEVAHNHRVQKLAPDGKFIAEWKGPELGFYGPRRIATGPDDSMVAVDPTTNKVYVADPRNKRIQVFDSNGKFLTKWVIPEWGRPAGFEDLAIDSKVGRLYASSANLDAVLIFDLNGTRIGSLTPKPPDKLEGPSALVLTGRKLYVLNMHANRVSEIDL